MDFDDSEDVSRESPRMRIECDMEVVKDGSRDGGRGGWQRMMVADGGWLRMIVADDGCGRGCWGVMVACDMEVAEDAGRCWRSRRTAADDGCR